MSAITFIKTNHSGRPIFCFRSTLVFKSKLAALMVVALLSLLPAQQADANWAKRAAAGATLLCSQAPKLLFSIYNCVTGGHFSPGYDIADLSNGQALESLWDNQTVRNQLIAGTVATTNLIGGFFLAREGVAAGNPVIAAGAAAALSAISRVWGTMYFTEYTQNRQVNRFAVIGFPSALSILLGYLSIHEAGSPVGLGLGITASTPIFFSGVFYADRLALGVLLPALKSRGEAYALNTALFGYTFITTAFAFGAGIVGDAIAGTYDATGPARLSTLMGVWTLAGFIFPTTFHALAFTGTWGIPGGGGRHMGLHFALRHMIGLDITGPALVGLTAHRIGFSNTTTSAPSMSPSGSPIGAPTYYPTDSPTPRPTPGSDIFVHPTSGPTANTTFAPTGIPTLVPTYLAR